MTISRRKVLGHGAGLGAVVVAGPLVVSSVAPAYAGAVEDIIAEFTGGTEPGSGKVTLGAPEIAENGNTVPIKVSVESAMSADDYAAEVLIIATGNPQPKVAILGFSPMSGSADASTRIRLAKTQDLIAIAKMSDGSFYRDTKTVKVTIGGCGG
ncbi:MAG: thiosulfate oxidation carrier protein SoxY [Rhizobiaceae bacterium]|nr:thiosulfate oxidation carrier protein SoxY [Rhizobiaceae bacterium]